MALLVLHLVAGVLIVPDAEIPIAIVHPLAVEGVPLEHSLLAVVPDELTVTGGSSRTLVQVWIQQPHPMISG